jgi:hypothetical protein
MPDYVVDIVEWAAPVLKTLDLPLHVDAQLVSADMDWSESWIGGGQGEEDGFRFLTQTESLPMIPAENTVRLQATVGGKPVDLWVSSDSEFEVWRATAPGPPGKPPARFVVLRSRENISGLRVVYSWAGGIKDAKLFPSIDITHSEGRQLHKDVEHGWQVEIHVKGAKSTIDLEGLVEQTTVGGGEGAGVHRIPAYVLIDGETYQAHLGEEHYRRSEQTWTEAGSPTADVSIHRTGKRLAIQVSVNAERSFAEPGALNPLDNENADINGAGIQLYLQPGRRKAGYVIVPDSGDRVSMRPIDGWGGAIPVEGTWHATRDGYEVNLVFDADAEGVYLDLIVNEKPAGRQRRRGQLALTGGGGDFIYLRGDRHDGSMIYFHLKND